MRLPHDQHTISPIGLDSSCHPSSAFNGFPAPLLNSSTGYHPDVSTFYTPNTHIYSNLETKSRYSGSESTSSTGMSHVQRSAALPTPSYSARDLYTRAIPSYPGRLDHAARSATTVTPLRRHPLSPTPSPSVSFTSPSSRMDAAQFSSGQQPNVPPLLPLTTLGRLCHSDPNNSPVNLDIQGTIDKGFFYSEGDWTCYRRNYFSCMCSYNYTPMLPSTSIQFTPDNSSHTYTVFGFAMSISAVVAESDSTQIDLVQHTPKRDKGPVSKPEKVRLEPRPPQQMGMYSTDHTRMFEGGYMVNSRGSYPTEHTFERIQFKQATANNGKRRAAQQYYHLVIELYADVGTQSSDQSGYIKIAQRKSAKMIVRGRSPGHYQQDRRGSTGSGGGNSNGMGGYGGHPVLGSDYGSGPSSLLPSTYGNSGYDGRHTGHYSTTRHVDVCRDTTMAEDPKLPAEAKDYQYFPDTIYENTTDANSHRVEMFTHRNDHNEHLGITRPAAVGDGSRVKPEYDGHASTLYNPGAAYYPGNCQRFEGRSTSSGYYPTIPTNIN